MTTLDAKTGVEIAPTTSEDAPAPTIEQSTNTAALITEQQMLLASAAALAPAPGRMHAWSRAAHAVAAPVHALFAGSEEPRARNHYPQRFGYFENSLMSREMDRL
jgi:hypothetical protein